MIIFTPQELPSLAAKSRAEADEIQKGPISHFACDAVFDLNSQAYDYDRDANELDAAIAAHDRNVVVSVDVLKDKAETSCEALREAKTAWHRAFATREADKSVELALTSYHDARKRHHAVVAALLIALGKS